MDVLGRDELWKLLFCQLATCSCHIPHTSFHRSLSNPGVVVSHCGFNFCVSLMANYDECFLYACLPFVSVHVLCPFSNWKVFLIVEFWEFFMYPGYKIFCQIYGFQCFLLVYSLSLYPLTSIYWKVYTSSTDFSSAYVQIQLGTLVCIYFGVLYSTI